MGLLNEVLCIYVAQGATKLPEVKVGDRKEKSRTQPQVAADQVGWQNFSSGFQL